MGLMKSAVAFATASVVLGAVTIILWSAKAAGIGPLHPAFFYLLPVAFVAIVHGSTAATLCAFGAALCSAFFLYDPVWSFEVANPLEYGDVICFMALALMAVKCTTELLRPSKASAAPTAKSRHERLEIFR